MSDNFRYRYGDTKPVLIPFKNAVAVAIGDLIFEDDSDGYTAKPAASLTWQSAVSSPATPTATNSAVAVGSAFANAAYHVKATYSTAYGETAPSAAAAVTPTAGASIAIAAVVLPAGVTSINYYCEDTAGSGNFYLVDSNKGKAFLITGPGGTGASQPPAGNLSATDVTQQLFVSKFVGVAAQRFDGTNTTAYGIKDGKLRIDTDGVFDFACASATFNMGDLVGPAKDTGNALLSQTVVAVSNRAKAIGQVVLAGTSLTTVRVQITSTKGRIGVNPQPLP